MKKGYCWFQFMSVNLSIIVFFFFFSFSQRAVVETFRAELLELQQTCRCVRRPAAEERGDRKRQHDALQDEEETGRPAKKRGEWRS